MKVSLSQLPALVFSLLMILGLGAFYVLHSQITERSLRLDAEDHYQHYLLDQINLFEMAILHDDIGFIRNWVAAKAENTDTERVLVLDPSLQVIASDKIALEQQNLAELDVQLFKTIQKLSLGSQHPLVFLPKTDRRVTEVLMPLPFFSDEFNRNKSGWLYIKFNLADTLYLGEQIAQQNYLLYACSILFGSILVMILLKTTLSRRLGRIEQALKSYRQGLVHARVPNSEHHEFSNLEQLLNATFDDLEREKLASTREKQFSQQVIASTTDGIITVDPQGKIIMANPQVVRIFGYDTIHELENQHLNDLIPENFRAKHNHHMFHASQQPKRAGVINRIRQIDGLRKDGSTCPIEITVSELEVDHKKYFTAFIKDNSEQRAYQLSIEKLAFYDDITDLPNLNGLIQQLDKTVFPCYINLIDIDGLSSFNDSYGTEFGDYVIRESASLLHQLRLDNLQLAHIKGGRFVLLSHSSREQINEQLLTILNLELQFKALKIHLSFCCSQTVYNPEKTFEEQLRQCEIAIRQAKSKGRGSFIEVDFKWVNLMKRQAWLSHQLEYALAQDSLYFVFQAKFAAQSRLPVSAEALIRWKLNDEIISPAEFIPLAEQSYLMPSVDRFVIREACRLLRQWLDRGVEPLQLSINLSARYLFDDKTIRYIFEKLGEFDLPGHYLEIEVTEYSLIRDVKATVNNMQRLQRAGIAIAIDDYGTGHSNLETVLSLPLQNLKIDQSFIRDGMSSEKGRAILENILQLAQALQIKTTAEGVETEEQLQFLQVSGCDYIQGYLLSKPLPLEQYEQVQISAQIAQKIASHG